jgi:hypothetical protein
MIKGFWLIAGVYLYVNVSAADMGSGPVLESPVFYPPLCYHIESNQQYTNSCTVSWKGLEHVSPS